MESPSCINLHHPRQYQFVPTIAIVEGMQREGFQVVKAVQSRTRIEGKGEFTKHMLRFRRSDQQLAVGDTFPEIVLVNSHDGTSSYSLYAGMFRLACLNGMVCSVGELGEYRTRHTGDIQGEVIEASYKIVSEFPQLIEHAQAWKRTAVTTTQQLAYANAAALLRWEEDQAKPMPEQLLAIRRGTDAQDAATLWGTYNRVQEAITKGGNRVNRRRTRAVTGIDQDVKLNRALWALTEKMATLV
jgi:hypothetical protein